MGSDMYGLGAEALKADANRSQLSGTVDQVVGLVLQEPELGLLERLVRAQELAAEAQATRAELEALRSWLAGDIDQDRYEDILRTLDKLTREVAGEATGDYSYG